MAVDFTNIVIAVISLLILALVALGIVMLIYCKSRQSLAAVRKTHRKRRGASVSAAVSKLPTSGSSFAQTRKQTWAARQPRQLQLQQQRPLFPPRSAFFDFGRLAQPVAQQFTPYYPASTSTDLLPDRLPATRPVYGAQLRPTPSIPRQLYLPNVASLQQTDNEPSFVPRTTARIPRQMYLPSTTSPQRVDNERSIVPRREQWDIAESNPNEDFVNEVYAVRVKKQDNKNKKPRKDQRREQSVVQPTANLLPNFAMAYVPRLVPVQSVIQVPDAAPAERSVNTEPQQQHPLQPQPHQQPQQVPRRPEPTTTSATETTWTAVGNASSGNDDGFRVTGSSGVSTAGLFGGRAAMFAARPHQQVNGAGRECEDQQFSFSVDGRSNFR